MRWLIAIGLAVVVVVVAAVASRLVPDQVWDALPLSNTYTVERTDYSPPVEKPDDSFKDDTLADKKTKFDPELVHSQLEGVWKVNLSDAVIRLDVPIVKPDVDAPLLELHKSYSDAIKSYQSKFPHGIEILPSINMIDGKAKQFDDGLYAAIDLAYYQGVDKVLVGHTALVRRFFEKVGPSSPAAPFLAAGLGLAGIKVEVDDKALRDKYIAAFESQPVRSKPIGFYTWNDKLGELFRFLRFFQANLSEQNARALVEAMKADPALRADYAKLMGFFSKLTNPRASGSLIELADNPKYDKSVSFLPPAETKETRLFETLFPLGLPPNADLMREMVKAIKSGEVKLEPNPDSGWYDHQVFALETMLLQEKGPEHDKLLLTKGYKKRMLEAFRALITKRRETHSRDAKTAMPTAAAPPPSQMQPRLRLEPAPTFYLRTARAYGFLATFLESALGEPTLKSLHGLKAEGERPKVLKTELEEMRELFYGCYLLSCEDIGMKAALVKDERVDPAKAMKFAEAWLKSAKDDADLAVDTRVIVPVYADFEKTKCWSTLGVRLAKLDVRFATPPSIKEAKDGGAWIKPEPYTLSPSEYLIAVDEFAEIGLKGQRVLTREEFRSVCDTKREKDQIVRALED